MELIIASIIAFASTNIDDIFILSLFFGDKRYKTRDIYVGQYLGIIALITISLIGSLIGNFIDAKYVGLLGLFPIYLGLKQLLKLIKKEKIDEELEKEEKNSKTGILNVATVTFANGGDNIGTYIPLFSALTTTHKSIVVAIFLAMVLAWLVISKYLAAHPLMAKVISKYGHIVTPVVLILLGLFIIKENGTINLLK